MRASEEHGDADGELVFNPGQRIQLASLTSAMLASQSRLQVIENFTHEMEEAPSAVRGVQLGRPD